MLIRTNKSVFFALSFFGFSVLSFSQTAIPYYAPDPTTLMGARSSGRAHSTVASELEHDSLLQNPASSVFKSQYAVSLEYGIVGDSLAASIVDTQSGPVGGGIYYSRRDFEGVDLSLLDSSYGNFERIEEQAGFALMGKFSEQFGIGATIKWSYIKSLENDVPNGRAWTFDLGSRIKVNNTIAIGILGQNLLKDNRGLIPRKLSAGAEFTPVIGLDLSAEVNSVESRTITGLFELPNQSQTIGWALGTQYRFAQGATIRAGYQESPAWNQSAFTLGAGFQNKSFSADYAYQKSLEGNKGTTHMVGFTGYF